MLEVTLNIYVLMAVIFICMALGFMFGRSFEQRVSLFTRLRNMDEEDMKKLIERWGRNE